MIEGFKFEKERLDEVEQGADINYKDQLYDLKALLDFMELEKEGKAEKISFKTCEGALYWQKSKDEILQRIEDIETIQESREYKISGPGGWGYMNNACYLNQKQLDVYDELKNGVKSNFLDNLDFDTLFVKINHLTYLHLEIENLVKYQKNRRNGDIIKSHTKKLIDILNILEPDDDAVPSLVRKLATLSDKKANDIIPYETRIAYIKEKNNANITGLNNSNINLLSSLRNQYKQKVVELRKFFIGFARPGCKKDAKEDAGRLMFNLDLPQLRVNKDVKTK